jgi:hypothetical protein
MWKLKVAEGGSPWLRTLNNHVGRQIWEFDPNSVGSPQDLHQIESARQNFHINRFTHKHSDDLLMRIQVLGAIQYSILNILFVFFMFCFQCMYLVCQREPNDTTSVTQSESR